MAYPKLDCPFCGRKNVEGSFYRDSQTKKLQGATTGLSALAGIILGGPVGLIAGLAAAKALDKVSENLDEENEYIFTCPNPDCRKTWIRKIRR